MSSIFFGIFLSLISLFSFLEVSVFNFSKLKKDLIFEERSINREKSALAFKLLNETRHWRSKRFKGESLEDIYLLVELTGKEKTCTNRSTAQISDTDSLHSQFDCELEIVFEHSFFSENLIVNRLTSKFLSSKGKIEINDAESSLIIAGGDISIKRAHGALYLFSGTGKISVNESSHPIYAKAKKGVPANSLEPPSLLLKSRLILGIIASPEST